MGFWNALSVLAPVAPALSDAQDIRTQRAQDAAKFAQDQEMAKARTTVEQFAGQEAQQRVRAGNMPMYKPGSQPEYSTALGAMAQPVWDYNKQGWEMQRVPGDTPEEQSKYQLDSIKKNRVAVKEMIPDATPEQVEYLSYTLSGVKPLPGGKFTPLAPAAGGQPQLGPDGKSYVIYGRDENGNMVSKPMDANFKPPVKPPVMKPGIGDGRNTNAYYSMDQKAWIDSNTNQPLRQFVPFPSFAQTGLYGIDTGYDAQGNPVPIMLNRRTGQIAPTPAGLVAPAQSKGIEAQRTTAIQGDSLLRTMLASADKAKSGDQQAMLSILSNHIGMTQGAQVHGRITQKIIDEAAQSAPWLQNVTKKWGPNGYLQGVTLSPQQVDQMVELGKLRRDVMWQQAAQTAEAAGIQLQIPPFAETFKGNPASSPAKGGGTAKKTAAQEAQEYMNGGH